jgi:preprotein translocase subunit SecE
METTIADKVKLGETLQTTGAVFAFVALMALFLWVSDKTLEWLLYDVILGWRRS